MQPVKSDSLLESHQGKVYIELYQVGTCVNSSLLQSMPQENGDNGI